MPTSTITAVDVAVIGGGLAGVAAAIAAARRGSSVALLGNRPVLGGNSSSEIRVWVCGATAHGAQKFARETGVMGELFLENQYRNREGNPFYWDQVILDAVRAEAGIQLFLNTDVRSVTADGPADERHIRSVTGWQMGTETTLTIEADAFVDATGDGTIGALAGARYRVGREQQTEFNESWAPSEADSATLGSTILFYTKDLGYPVDFVPPTIARDVSKTPIVTHRTINPRDSGCHYWWIEWGGELDALADNELIRDELWAVVYGIWDHIKNSGKFEAESLTLEWVGSVPGKREYRRFIGDYTLTQADIMQQRRFEDAIGFGGWSIDLHPAGGMYSTEPGSRHLYTSGLYHIPFRSLYSINVRNLLFAGRNISASHVAFGSTRVMATCAVTGEAAGAGAALAAKHRLSPREIVHDRLPELRRSLLRGDASLLGAIWDEPEDLARRARVSSSSTLTSLDSPPREDESRFLLLERDLGIHLPVDPRLDTFGLLVDCARELQVTTELWTTLRGENHIPVKLVKSVQLDAMSGQSWLDVQFNYEPVSPEDVVIIVRAQPGLSVVVTPAACPYGVIGMLRRQPAFTVPENEAFPPSNEWSVEELRRQSIAMRVMPATRAFAPENVVNEYSRPFAGPQMWSSAAMSTGVPEHLELRWDTVERITEVQIIFNDDPHEDLVNLHHHETPFRVIPDLVRDYRIQARVNEEWADLVSITDNRHRNRRHPLPTPIKTDGIRVLIESTNGSPWATVTAVRVFDDPDAG